MFTSGLITKVVSSYPMSEMYRSEAEKFLLETMTIFDDDLLFFAITGSCALGFCIEGWSDINVLIVTKTFDPAKNELAYKVSNNHGVPITLTLLTKYEFENSLLDDKTRVAIWQINEGMIYPNYVRGEMILPSITMLDIQDNDKVMLPIYLHKLRILFWEDTVNRKHRIIKMLYTVIKMSLRKQHCITYSYAGAVQKFAQLYGEQEFDIFVEVASSSTGPSPGFLNYAKKVVKRICEHGI